MTAANVCPWVAMLAIFCSCNAPCFLRELGMLEPEAEGKRGEERGERREERRGREEWRGRKEWKGRGRGEGEREGQTREREGRGEREGREEWEGSRERGEEMHDERRGGGNSR